MKKFFTIVLALILVLSVCATTAFAATDGTTDMSSITFTKNYEATNANTTSPAETFAFTISNESVTHAASGVTTANMPTPTVGNVSYTAGEAGSASKSKNITITLPEYNSVGIYSYTIKETAGTTAGVTYFGSDITLVVTVQQGADGRFRVAAVHTETSGAAKSDNFPNTYSAGSLSVSKKVTGNMGDRDKEFTATVTFTKPADKTVREAITYVDGTETKTIATTAWDINGKATATITLKHGETVTFKNIPYEVTYTVTETDYTNEGYDAAVYEYSDNTNKKIDSASDTVKITNNKGTTVDTGISLDSLPYIVLLAVAAVGLVVFFVKKRTARED